MLSPLPSFLSSLSLLPILLPFLPLSHPFSLPYSLSSFSLSSFSLPSFLSYEEFLKETNELNKLDTYPQLLSRARHIGYHVTKVVYRGYEASVALQVCASNDGPDPPQTSSFPSLPLLLFHSLFFILLSIHSSLPPLPFLPSLPPYPSFPFILISPPSYPFSPLPSLFLFPSSSLFPFLFLPSSFPPSPPSSSSVYTR